MTFLLEIALAIVGGFIFWAVRSLWCKAKGKEKPSLVLNVISAALVLTAIELVCGLI